MKKNSKQKAWIDCSESTLLTPNMETGIGLKGRKKRVSLNGARNAIPYPPFVIASKIG